MNAYTPGPWRVIAYEARLTIHGDYRIAVIDKNPDGDTSNANARLIAAAPDLLAELIHLQQAYANRHSPQHRAAALISAGAAISKAEGKP